jgi:hypothetical protein
MLHVGPGLWLQEKRRARPSLKLWPLLAWCTIQGLVPSHCSLTKRTHLKHHTIHMRGEKCLRRAFLQSTAVTARMKCRHRKPVPRHHPLAPSTSLRALPGPVSIQEQLISSPIQHPEPCYACRAQIHLTLPALLRDVSILYISICRALLDQRCYSTL